ncbi:MAG TPA: DUF2065 domain-containing protein [Aestuariivirga sp.]|jgi:hypothetical protein|nr:DUF2065 domain-containing protein [Aestuariivirga sp.]
MMHALLMALGLVFVIEGLLYALVPGHLKNMMKAMGNVPDETLRMGGMAALGFGVFIVWVVKAFFV